MKKGITIFLVLLSTIIKCQNVTYSGDITSCEMISDSVIKNTSHYFIYFSSNDNEENLFCLELLDYLNQKRKINNIYCEISATELLSLNDYLKGKCDTVYLKKYPLSFLKQLGLFCLKNEILIKNAGVQNYVAAMDLLGYFSCDSEYGAHFDLYYSEKIRGEKNLDVIQKRCKKLLKKLNCYSIPPEKEFDYEFIRKQEAEYNEIVCLLNSLIESIEQNNIIDLDLRERNILKKRISESFKKDTNVTVFLIDKNLMYEHHFFFIDYPPPLHFCEKQNNNTFSILLDLNVSKTSNKQISEIEDYCSSILCRNLKIRECKSFQYIDLYQDKFIKHRYGDFDLYIKTD